MELKHTPLFEEHLALKAKLVDFGGWALPVQYEGITKEHLAVRQAVGMFDVSHMGEIFLLGDLAVEAADRLCSNDISSCPPGKALYSVMMNADGGIIDDVIVYRFSDKKVLLCVNASNIAKDAAWINAVVAREFPAGVTVSQESEQWGQIAVQGPLSIALLAKIFGPRITDVKPFHFAEIKGLEGGATVIAARTGYTGEDGFELFIPKESTASYWRQLLALGAQPCGLGARDTLRLEAGLCLYGNDINEDTTPLDAGLAWVVKLNKKNPALGFPALRRCQDGGGTRKLCGLMLDDKKIARHGYKIFALSGEMIGEVTSGTLTPTLNRPIAMAYVPGSYAELDTKVMVEIRGSQAEAQIVGLPFYRR